MRSMRALALGAVATGILAYSVATVLAITVASTGSAIDVEIGPLAVLVVEQLGATGGSATTLGPGLLLVALAGGVVNAVAALVLARRERRRSR